MTRPEARGRHQETKGLDAEDTNDTKAAESCTVTVSSVFKPSVFDALLGYDDRVDECPVETAERHRRRATWCRGRWEAAWSNLCGARATHSASGRPSSTAESLGAREHTAQSCSVAVVIRSADRSTPRRRSDHGGRTPADRKTLCEDRRRTESRPHRWARLRAQPLQGRADGA